MDTKEHIQTRTLKNVWVYTQIKNKHYFKYRINKKVSKCNTSIEFVKKFSHEQHQDRWHLDYGGKFRFEGT